MQQKKPAKFFTLSLMTIRKYHWMSAALCFVCMLLFSITGITLHHSRILLPAPDITHMTGQLPPELLPILLLHINEKKLAVPEPIEKWLSENKKITLSERRRTEIKKEGGTTDRKEKETEVKETATKETQTKERTEKGKAETLASTEVKTKPDKFNAAFNRPGVVEKITIHPVTGEFEYEKTDKGLLAYFNDLHKGKNTGMAWVYFIDLFAIACIIFSVTGFLLLQRYAKTRANTWPLLMAGFFLPVFFVMFLVH